MAGVLVLLSLILITVYFREPAGGGLHSVQGTGATVLRPFEVGANRVAAPFRDAYGWFAGLIHAKSENAKLRREVDQLRAAAILNANAAQQNSDLRAQLHYIGLPRFPQDYNPVPTDVISRPASEFEQQIGIAAGSSSGIRVNDPVVTSDGLVGKISAVAPHTAQVTLLTDPNLNVSAQDAKTQATGLVSHGEGPGTLTLSRVQKSSVLREGDPIVTQGWKVKGYSSIYPYGIPIGTVSGATNSEVDLYWNAQVSPFVHFDSLQSVLVLVPKTRNRP
ncbi:MAG TPA: rod shape-determining protein MreC [Gaiellaceae bacterium]|nr:rod shape-determining protein MreC [Gaiellaceae bacterium]